MSDNSRKLHNQKKNQKHLTIKQVNVGRGGAANDLALSLGYKHDMDIIMIKEPWISRELDRKICKKHKKYQAYAPKDKWDERPRVVTYVRIGTLAEYTEKCQDMLRTDGSSDILLLEIQLRETPEPPIYLVNLYNAPVASQYAEKAAEQLMGRESLMSFPVFVAEDLNLHHIDWDAKTLNPIRQAKEFSDWVSNNTAFSELPTGTVTQSQGRAIDLVVSSCSLTNSVVKCSGEPELDCTSDHRTIRITVECNDQFRKQIPGGRFRLDKMNQKEFVFCLKRQKNLVESKLAMTKQERLSEEKRIGILDNVAELLGANLFQALELSTLRPKKLGGGEPWWDEKC